MQNTIPTNNFISSFFLFVLFTMSLAIVSINAGINIRVGQLAILLMFALVLLQDFKNRDINETLLIFFVFFAILLTFVSKNSSYSKIDEMKFVIKYSLIFPATFYIGQWTARNFKTENFLKILEISLAFYIFMGFFLSVYPIPFLYNDRGEISGFQGTFLEAGWFALVVSSFTMISILGRLDFNFKFIRFHYILYFFSLLSLILSKNKTIWIGMFLIITFITLFKSIISNKQNVKDSVKKLKVINPSYFVFAFIIFITIFVAVNSVLSEPIVSTAMLEEKLNDERGKAYLVAINLLKNSDWMGGYGFGFIEQYFSVYTDEIIGLGEGSGMLFNSYLDIWISVGIFGLLFHMLLLNFSFSRTHLLTMILPLYCFIAANTNPTIGDEYYYLFLGISYGFIIKYKKEVTI
jgi:hypothetical protein